MNNEQTSYRDIINNYINGNKAEAVRQIKAYNVHAFTELLETDENMLLYEKYKILKTYCLLCQSGDMPSSKDKNV